MCIFVLDHQTAGSSIISRMWRRLLLVLVCSTTITSTTTRAPSSPRVVVISMDGFRYDYIDRMRLLVDEHHHISYLHAFADAGIRAPQGVQNVYATKTFPNHYSLATGLYEETHGVVANYIFDEELNRTISLSDFTTNTKEQLAYYYKGTPIWVTAANQLSVDRVACYMWLGCDLPIANVTIERAMAFNLTPSCDHTVDWLRTQLTAGVQLAMVYLQQPDRAGHRFELNSAQMNETFLALNECIGRLLHLISADDTNVLIVSDHGMIEFTRDVRIDVDDTLFWVRGSDYSEWLVDPKPGKMQATIDFFRRYDGITVYRKDEIPDRWHYGHNVYVTNVLVVADIGVRIIYGDYGNYSLVAGHGYDNRYWQMRPGFFARGPDLLVNASIDYEAWSNIDVYLLVSALLGVVPADNNGSCEHVAGVLRPESIRRLLGGAICPSIVMSRRFRLTPFIGKVRTIGWSTFIRVVIVSILIILVTFAICFGCIYMWTHRRSRHNFNKTLEQRIRLLDADTADD